MPCYDSRSTYSYGVEETEAKYKNIINEEKKKNEWLEAVLCAVFNELQKRDVLGSVVAEASRNGLIGIMDFWQHHLLGILGYQQTLR